MENDNQETGPKVISIRNSIHKNILKRGEEEVPDLQEQPITVETTEPRVIPFDPIKRQEQKILSIIVRDTKSF